MTARIFPLLALGGRRSPFVDALASELAEAAFDVSIDSVSYEFQRGGNQMTSFATRKADGNIPLWVLFLAVQWLDVIWGCVRGGDAER